MKKNIITHIHFKNGSWKKTFSSFLDAASRLLSGCFNGVVCLENAIYSFFTRIKYCVPIILCLMLASGPIWAATEFGVADDLTVKGATGDFKDADVEIAGFTTHGSTIGLTLHLGIKVGSIWAAGGIEASSYSYFGSSITVISSVTAGALNVSGWANFASTVTIGERHLILEGGTGGQVLFYDAAGAYWATAATEGIQSDDDILWIGTHTWVSSATFRNPLFSVGGSTFVVTAGKVGIGTTAPNTLLEVSGAGNVYMRVTSEDDQKPGIEFFRPGDFYTDWRVENSGGLLYFRNSADDFVITNTAIAMASISGSALLDPDTVDVSVLKLRIIRSDNSNNEAVGMGFAHSSDFSNIGAAIIHRTVGAESQGTLEFATKDTTVTDADIPIRMTIDHTGRVGIGTTDPFEKLHVVGDLLVSSGSITSNYGVKSSTHVFKPGSQPASAEEGSVYYHDSTDKLRLQTASGWVDIATGTVGGGNFVSKDGDTMTGQLTVHGSSITIVNTVATNAFSLAVTTAADRSVYHFVVSTMGNVGIGTTNPGTKLEVAGQIKITGGSPGTDKVLTSNASGLATWETPMGGGGGDNFGSHIATENVKLNGHWLSGDGGNEGIFVKADGNVGIATAAPAGLFTVGNGTMTVFADGRIGIGTTDPQAMHHVQSSQPELYAMLVSTGPAPSEYIISVSSEGITNIKNFVVENRANDPADPVTGQIWMIVP